MKLLLVEDTQELSEVVAAWLEYEQQFSVDIIDDGEKALSRVALSRDDYSLILLDYNLPHLSGYEICKQIRAMNITIPILMLTAESSINTKVKMLDAGADDYLTKPFSFDELSARVKALLRRPKGYVSEEITLGDFTVNTNAQTLIYKKAIIPLTPKEYRLVEFFFRNPNILFTRDDIVAKLWDYQFDSMSNVIDVHITNLRKKVMKATKGKTRLIETHRGRGYMLVELL